MENTNILINKQISEEDFSHSLNEEQLKPVMATEGPVIVFAGAGSGKTRTLTFRVAYMITMKHIPPYNILAITFTNKATDEMRERLHNFLDIDTKLITISTFHSLCARILRRDIEAIGYKRDFTILDEDDQVKVITEISKALNCEKGKVKKFQKEINYSKCFMTSPKGHSDPEFERVFEEYEKKMKEENLLDFEDLLIKVYELFSKNPDILFKYQNKFKYILVDEFQDTNLIQYKILKMLTGNNRNLFVVGDDDQSIYSFRGTNYENISLFKEDFPDYKLFTLCQNYRSSQTIVEVANRLISFNKNRERKQMKTEIEGSIDDVVVINPENEFEESEYIANKICGLKSANCSYTDFAVLYRSSVLVRNLEIAMIRHNIPYKVYGGISYLRRKEVKDMIAYFRLMLNHDDLNSFKRIVNVPPRGIGDVTLENLLSVRKTCRANIIDTIGLSETIIPSKRYLELANFRNMIEKYTAKIDDEYLVNIFDEFIQEIHYIDYINNTYEKEEAKDKIENLKEFKSVLFNIDSDTLGLNKIDRIREAFDEAVLSDNSLQNQRESKDGVTLSTIHSVKGLEFKYVFLMGMEDSIFPNSLRVQSDDELEEERRICYVAITRAKEIVNITHCKNRRLYGSRFTNKPSRFINECMGTKETIKNSKVFNILMMFIQMYKIIV